MRPITQILSVFLFALLTSVGMAQFTTPHFNDWPSEVNFQNWSFDTTPKGVVNMADAPFTKTGGFDIPGFRRWTSYQKPDSDGSGGYTIVNFMQYAWGTHEVQVMFFNPGANQYSPIASTAFSGSSFTNLSLMGSPTAFNSPPVPPGLSNYVNGLSADGTSLVGGAAAGGGSGGGGGGSVIAEQAAQLNIGLTFQDGQWTPSNN